MRGHTSNSSPTTKRKGPSFFKMMVAPNSTQYHMLKIPEKYVKSYKEQLAKDYVKLRVINIDDGRSWNIELLKKSGEIWLNKGWEEIVKTYSLKYGYFLLFRYKKRDSEFHVRIFDTTCCEVESDFAFDFHTNKGKEVIELSSEDEYMSRDDDDNDISSEDGVAMDGKTRFIPCCEGFQSRNPHFKVWIGHWNYTSRGVMIPLDYARVHLKDKHKKELILKGPNDRKRCYKLKLYVYLHNCYKVKAELNGSAWQMFVRDNELRIGDGCVFELIHPQSNTYKVTIFRAP